MEPEDAAKPEWWVVVEGDIVSLHLAYDLLYLQYILVGIACMLKRLCTLTLRGTSHDCRSSCSSVGECHEWVSVVGAGRSTSV